MNPLRCLGLVFFLFVFLLPQADAGGKARHVVLVIWDGLRPAFVTKENTPVLAALAAEGVFFSKHHSVYPTLTIINGTALATGMYPETSGVIGNSEYRPEIDPAGPVSMESVATVLKGDEVSGGKFLAVPTIEEQLQQQGFRTVVAGTKGVALIADRSQQRTLPAAKDSAVVFKGAAFPAEMRDAITADHAAFPETITYPNTAQDAWTTQVLINTLWKKDVPKLSVLWLSDPDYSQHNSAPGSPEALAGLRSSDANLGKVLAALEQRGLRDATDILVVSDHGFSTISESADMVEVLRKNGFDATRRLTERKNGQVLILSQGGSGFFFVTGHDREVIAKLTSFLQTSGVASVIFTREALPGTFSLKQARIESPHAPDIAISYRWSDKPNAYGVRGMVQTDAFSARGKILGGGQGMHGSLSPYDLHNTLIAAGPDFRTGWVNPVPSGNIDVAPTIAAILDLIPVPPMEGRVLSEALRDAKKLPEVKRETWTATVPVGGGQWNQSLAVESVAGRVYFNEGQGSHSAEKPSAP